VHASQVRPDNLDRMTVRVVPVDKSPQAQQEHWVYTLKVGRQTYHDLKDSKIARKVSSTSL
jgi:hypothetical protein